MKTMQEINIFSVSNSDFVNGEGFDGDEAMRQAFARKMVEAIEDNYDAMMSTFYVSGAFERSVPVQQNSPICGVFLGTY